MLKLSIIIPVYNVESYLRQCFDSAIYPELEGYEIIAVNDGSTDASPAICREYAERYPHLVRTVTTPNGGLSHARKTGMELAQGEYWLFLDSDDYLSPQAVPEMLETIEQGFDICFFDYVNVTETGKVLKYVRSCPREGTFTLESYPELLFEMPNACCKLWRRSLFTDNNILFPDKLWYEDLATSPRLYIHAKKIVSASKPWYNYLQRSGSIINSKNLPRNLEIITAVDIALNYFKEQGLYEKYLPQLEYMAFYHQFLTASTRVNLLDWRSDIQDTLLRDFTEKFPNYRQNQYIQAIPRKYKLLMALIEHKQRLALNLIMRLNDRIKGKNT